MVKAKEHDDALLSFIEMVSKVLESAIREICIVLTIFFIISSQRINLETIIFFGLTCCETIQPNVFQLKKILKRTLLKNPKQTLKKKLGL